MNNNLGVPHTQPIATIPSEQLVIYHLLSVWLHFADGDHRCDSVGEDACEYLWSRGFVIDNGWQIELTDVGRELVQRFDNSPQESRL